jgi:hypothetical protein
MESGQPLAIAGLWRAWEEVDANPAFSFTMLTVNANEHPLMRRFHKLGDELSEHRRGALVPERHFGRSNVCAAVPVASAETAKRRISGAGRITLRIKNRSPPFWTEGLVLLLVSENHAFGSLRAWVLCSPWVRLQASSARCCADWRVCAAPRLRFGAGANAEVRPERVRRTALVTIARSACVSG